MELLFLCYWPIVRCRPSPKFGNYGYGSSTAAGSGGLPTGPSSLGGIYGLSTAAGSGGAPTGLTNLGTLGYGFSTSGGPGGVPTGPTNPIVPQFPAATGVASPIPRAPSVALLRMNFSIWPDIVDPREHHPRLDLGKDNLVRLTRQLGRVRYVLRKACVRANA